MVGVSRSQPEANPASKTSAWRPGASNAVAVIGDLRDPAFAERLKKETWGHFGRIDALVNIAGDAFEPNKILLMPTIRTNFACDARMN
jgi:NAD(P)-dependent dehydrogenase (short-subunit alcohol dehydrogenase family)